MRDPEVQAHPELLLLSIGRGRWKSLAQVLATWDMLNADIPPRSQLELAAAILLGSVLIEADDRGRLRPTRAAATLLSARSLKHLRSRQQLSELRALLQAHLRPPADYRLDEQTYRAAVEEYQSQWRSRGR